MSTAGLSARKLATSSFLSEPVRTRRNPTRTRLVAVAVVDPWVLRMVSPPRVLPLGSAARGRLVAPRHGCRRDNAAQLGWWLRRRGGFRLARRTTIKTVRAALEDWLVHLLRAAATIRALRVDDGGLNAMGHQRLNQSLLPIQGSWPGDGDEAADCCGRATGRCDPPLGSMAAI